MENKHCPNKATHLVPWAGKILMLCDVHTRGMQALSAAIGELIQVRLMENKLIECEGADDLDHYEQAERDVL